MMDQLHAKKIALEENLGIEFQMIFNFNYIKFIPFVQF